MRITISERSELKNEFVKWGLRLDVPGRSNVDCDYTEVVRMVFDDLDELQARYNHVREALRIWLDIVAGMQAVNGSENDATIRGEANNEIGRRLRNILLAMPE